MKNSTLAAHSLILSLVLPATLILSAGAQNSYNKYYGGSPGYTGAPGMSGSYTGQGMQGSGNMYAGQGMALPPGLVPPNSGGYNYMQNNQMPVPQQPDLQIFKPPTTSPSINRMHFAGKANSAGRIDDSYVDPKKSNFDYGGQRWTMPREIPGVNSYPGAPPGMASPGLVTPQAMPNAPAVPEPGFTVFPGGPF